MSEVRSSAYDYVKLIRNHATTIIDDTLYIDGGEILPLAVANISNSTTEGLYEPNPYIFTLDLTKGISEYTIEGLAEDGLLRVFNKETATKTSSGGAVYNYLWSDPRGATNRYVQFGGRTGDTRPEDPLASYNTETEEYGTLSLIRRLDDEQERESDYINPHHGAWTQSPDGIAYYLGGMDGGGRYLKQLIKLDLNSGVITVESTGDLPAVVGSQMAWFPVGKKGVLVTMGGEIQDSTGRIRSMPIEDIWVYDILSSTWYVQTATPADREKGLPINRKYHCAVTPSYTEAKDSYEFVLHGGHQTASDDNLKLDDLWSLTLPTFQWVQYYYGATGDTIADGAYNVSCAIPNDRYFMVVSTYGFGQEFANAPFAWFDLEDLAWVGYDPNENGYRKPEIIENVVRDRPGPDLWDNPALGEVFALSYTRGYEAPTMTSATSTPTATDSSPSSSTTTSTSTPGDNQGVSKTTTAAIAAGVTIGVIALIGLGILAWFLLRRRRRRQEKPIPDVPLPKVSESIDGRTSSMIHFGPGPGYLPELPSQRPVAEIDNQYNPHKFKPDELKTLGRFSPANTSGVPSRSQQR